MKTLEKLALGMGMGFMLGAGVMMKRGTKAVTPVILTVLGLLLLRLTLEFFGVWPF